MFNTELCNQVKALDEMQIAIDKAHEIAGTLTMLKTLWADGQITKAAAFEILETLQRRHTNELQAVIANLGFEVRP